MARILAVDYGDVRTGVAISDPLGFIASGLETIQRRGSDERVIQRLLELIVSYEIKDLILGLPLRTDGKSSEKAAKVQAFAAALRAALETAGLELQIHLRDERYSSVLANRILRDSDRRRRDKRDVVDQVAAEIILQDYLREQELGSAR